MQVSSVTRPQPHWMRMPVTTSPSRFKVTLGLAQLPGERAGSVEAARRCSKAGLTAASAGALASTGANMDSRGRDAAGARGTNRSDMGWSRFVGFGVQEDADAPVDFAGGFLVGHGNGGAEAGDFFDLGAGDAVLDELAADGGGAVGGDFPIAVIRSDGGVAALGVAFQLNGEGGEAGDFPGEGGEDPIAIGGKGGGLGLENGFMGAVKNIDEQTLGGEFEFDGAVALVFAIALKGLDEVLVDAAEHGEFDGGGGIEIAGGAFDGLHALVIGGDDAGGFLGDGGEGIA